MTINGSTQQRVRENKQIFWSALRLLIGGVLGAAAYSLVAKIILDQPYTACSSSLARSLIEASYFPASLLLGLILRHQPVLYQPLLYLLASAPYAVLGALIASGAKKVVILVLGVLVVFFLCGSWLAWAFLMSSICA
jgi:hypothetical protein